MSRINRLLATGTAAPEHQWGRGGWRAHLPVKVYDGRIDGAAYQPVLRRFDKRHDESARFEIRGYEIAEILFRMTPPPVLYPLIDRHGSYLRSRFSTYCRLNELGKK
jgi:hypothetical protein